MSSSNLTLTIPTKVAKSTKPALSKAEIIEVLAIRKHTQLKTVLDERNARLSSLSTQLAALVALLPAVPSQRSNHYEHDYTPKPPKPGQRYARCISLIKGVTLKTERTIQLADLPANVRTIIKAINNL